MFGVIGGCFSSIEGVVASVTLDAGTFCVWVGCTIALAVVNASSFVIDDAFVGAILVLIINFDVWLDVVILAEGVGFDVIDGVDVISIVLDDAVCNVVLGSVVEIGVVSNCT